MKEDFSILWGLFTNTAVQPTKRSEDAGYDLYEDTLYSQGISNFVLKAGETKRFDTNVGYVIPQKYAGIVKERSNTGKLSIIIGAGTLDSGYRNNCGVFITNCSNDDIVINFEDEKGNRKAIAQIVFIEHEEDENAKSIRTTPQEFAELYPSDRGLGREGSTKK